MKLFIILSVILIGCNKSNITEDHHPANLNSTVTDSIKILDSLTLYNRISKELLALTYARRCFYLANQMKSSIGLVTALNAIGNAYNSRMKDSSFYYYTEAIRTADSNKIFAKKSRLFLNLAMIYLDISNFKMATSLIDSSISLAVKYKQPGTLADAYLSFGVIKLAISDSIGAKKSFEKALEIGKENHLPRQCGNALGNISIFETDPSISMNLLKTALTFYHGLTGMEEEIALTYINLGFRQIIPDSAIMYYERSLDIAKHGGLQGAVISAYNNMAYAYLDKKEICKAEECLKTAIPLALNLGDADWLATLFDSYADVLTEKGQFDKALRYQKKAFKSKAMADHERSSAQVRLLSAMVDLHAKDALILQKDVDLQAEINKNRILKYILALSFLTVITFILILVWYNQRNRLNKTRAQMNAASRIIELEEMEKSRLGFELHDHVGYSIKAVNQVIQEYNFTNQSEKENILGKISDLQSSIRRFSHRMNPFNVQNEKFQDLFSDLVKDFSTISGIRITYYIPEYFPELQQKQLLHLMRIVQELLTNASKHAPGANVNINISTAIDKMIMIYSDDGAGFDTSLPGGRGFGFQSIEERIQLLEGKFTLKSTPGKGTTWEFVIPLV